MHAGIDIVLIRRIEKMATVHRSALGRFFTEQEIAYCQERGAAQYTSFAGIFAAKEAFYKALGTGFRTGKWTDVEVRHTDLGAPYLCFYNTYEEIMKEYPDQRPAVSISHDGEYAIAQVIW